RALTLSFDCCLWISQCRGSKLSEKHQGAADCPRLRRLKGRIIMSRKSLWIGFALMIVVATSVSVSVDARHKKKQHDRERSSAAPSVSLTAETYTVRACEDARVRLSANASSPNGSTLRYKWTTNGGRLRGDGASTGWDLSGVQPGVYQAFVEVDDGRDFACIGFSSISVVVIDCPPTPRIRPK